MEVEVLDQETANATLGVPIKHGYTSDLFGRRRGAQKRRKRHLYICRHCAPTDKSIDRSDSAPGMANLTEEEHKHKTKCAKRKMFSFDGLRSHAKTWCVRPLRSSRRQVIPINTHFLIVMEYNLSQMKIISSLQAKTV